jgi:hypothetical protein
VQSLAVATHFIASRLRHALRLGARLGGADKSAVKCFRGLERRDKFWVALGVRPRNRGVYALGPCRVNDLILASVFKNSILQIINPLSTILVVRMG